MRHPVRTNIVNQYISWYIHIVLLLLPAAADLLARSSDGSRL